MAGEMYQATSVQDGPHPVYLQSISAMPQYQDQSLEELCFVHYSKRIRSMENFEAGSSATTHPCQLCGNCSDVAGSGAPPSSYEVFDFTSSTQVAVPGPLATFGASPFAAAPLRQPFTPFGTTSLSALRGGTCDAPYQATSRQDGATDIRLQSISAMPTYQNQSHEELRFLDYELRKDEAALKTGCVTWDGQQSEVLGEIVPVARNVTQKGADCTPNYPPKKVSHCDSNLFDMSTKSASSLFAAALFEGFPSLNTARPSRKGYNRSNERIFRLRRQNRMRARIQRRRDVLPLPATGADSPPRDLRSARISISSFTRGTQADGPAYEHYLQVIENDGNKSQSFLPKLTKKGYELSPTIEMLSEANLSSVSKVSIKRPGFGKVEWEHSVDLRGADLDATVVIGRKAVSVHALNNNGVPQQGVKLNGTVLISFFAVFPDENASESSLAFAEKMYRATLSMGADFISYDGDSGVLRIRVYQSGTYSLDPPIVEASSIATVLTSRMTGSSDNAHNVEPIHHCPLVASSEISEVEKAEKAILEALNRVDSSFARWKLQLD
jgi:hypothetical protein